MTFRSIALFLIAGILVVGAACTKKPASNTTAENGQTVMVNTSVDQDQNQPVVDATNSSSSSDVTAAPTSVAVSVTSTGFSPATVTVAIGGTVTWKNDDSTRHQPASDPHPIHTGLPGFDAIGGIGPGATYQFTFTRAGTFSYHDHSFPLRQGLVIVQ
ncbi:MAG: cupredoxin domain-containing protein [Candidatus Kerfeldbacteria bacterium]|nr:cupredoxin domain-containing protein [Candidatus Kerfeldbacteria bacterium]